MAPSVHLIEKRLERKETHAIFPKRNRMSRSAKAYKSKVRTREKKPIPPDKSDLVTIYETNCGTSICCKLLSTFVRASGFPVVVKKADSSRAINKRLYDEADREVPDYVRSKIPAMEDNGFLLYDVRAIIRYLDGKFNGSVVIPSAPKEKAVVDQSFEHLLSTIHKSVANFIECKVFRPFFCKTAEVDNENCFLQAESNNYKREINIYLSYIEKHYFRDKNGEKLWQSSTESKCPIKMPKNPLKYDSKSPSQSPKRDNLSQRLYTQKGHLKIGGCSITIGSPMFTPISPPCFDKSDDANLIEKLCKIIGYTDSLDGIKALVDRQQKKIGENASWENCQAGIRESNKCVVLKPQKKLFVVLEQFTLADITLFVILDHLQFSDCDFKKNHRVIWAWWKQMLKISTLRDSNESLNSFVMYFKKNLSNSKGKCDFLCGICKKVQW